MRTIVFNTGFTMLFTLLIGLANAQDAGNTAAKRQFSRESEQADKQLGKKIQEQSLSQPFEKLETAAIPPPKNKRAIKKASRALLKTRA